MGSIKRMEMSLRNGKIKTEPIDSDDDYAPILKSRYNTRNSIIHMQTIKLEPDDGDDDADYVDETYKPEPFIVDRVLRTRVPKSKVAKSSDESEYSDDHDNPLGLDLNVMRKSVSNLIGKRPNQPALAQTSVIPIECNEKRSYCCYLCGKTFQHFCRLHIHMPAHTNKRKYQCSLCDKRYKSASSLNVHTKHCHLGKPWKSRSKLSSSNKPSKKAAVKKATISKYAIKLPKIKFEDECKKIVEVKLELSDQNVDNNMDVSLALDPLEIDEHVPFVWDECDTNLIMPMEPLLSDKVSLELAESEQTEEKIETTAAEINPLGDKMECIDAEISNETPLQTLKSSQVKPSKWKIWQKETTDPLAMHVNILRMSSPKRILFPAKLDAPNKTMSTHGNSTGYNMKNTSLAMQFRANGDTEFKQKNWTGARQWYNRTLCHAELNTFPFSTAYAKRAQSFFNEGLYRTCWTDLMLSQNAGLPEALYPQLERHKESCKFMIMRQQMLANQSTPSVPSSTAGVQPQLSFAANPLFPEMVSALQIDWNEYYGRHLRACQSIAVGQILIIETGFVASTTSFYEKCCICLTTDTNLVPCSRCTQALLCKNCVNGWFHQIECELQMSLDLDLNQYPWLAKVLRSFLLAINLFENVDEMMEFVDEAISNAAGMPLKPIVNQRSKYRAFLQLITAPFIQSEMIPIVAQLQTTLLNHPAIRSKFSSKKFHRFLAHLLVHHKCVIDAFTAKVGSSVCENGFTEVVAPITSYLKHSCAPNVSKFLLGKSIIVVAMRPIEPGEQLCVSYCNVLNTTIDRQNMLQMEYGFRCQCERCQSKTADHRQIQTHYCDAAEKFVQQNFVYLANNNQIKRKQLTDCVVAILQQFGRMPWNYTITWAYVVFSLLLSHRFQKKLLY